MNAYWWGGGGDHRGIKWMRWEKMCEAKGVGGMGFRKLREFNVAMLAKQSWRLVNSANKLVTTLMKARYYPHTSFLEAELGANPSYMWRSIIASQGAVKQGCRRKIGDGKSTREARE
ncbi:putative mitochondrial protein AtMg00310 [Apium graveolens]|uniref:putative mitochondrial protein AtMg00310 n=1 Tax=Apium graveolens TaxID=4045 RepID=UPI003D7A2785